MKANRHPPVVGGTVSILTNALPFTDSIR